MQGAMQGSEAEKEKRGGQGRTEQARGASEQGKGAREGSQTEQHDMADEESKGVEQ